MKRTNSLAAGAMTIFFVFFVNIIHAASPTKSSGAEGPENISNKLQEKKQILDKEKERINKGRIAIDKGISKMKEGENDMRNGVSQLNEGSASLKKSMDLLKKAKEIALKSSGAESDISLLESIVAEAKSSIFSSKEYIKNAKHMILTGKNNFLEGNDYAHTGINEVNSGKQHIVNIFNEINRPTANHDIDHDKLAELIKLENQQEIIKKYGNVSEFENKMKISIISIENLSLSVERAKNIVLAAEEDLNVYRKNYLKYSAYSLLIKIFSPVGEAIAGDFPGNFIHKIADALNELATTLKDYGKTMASQGEAIRAAEKSTEEANYVNRAVNNDKSLDMILAGGTIYALGSFMETLSIEIDNSSYASPSRP